MSYMPCCCEGCTTDQFCVTFPSNSCESAQTVCHGPSSECCPCVERRHNLAFSECATVVCTPEPVYEIEAEGNQTTEYWAFGNPVTWFFVPPASCPPPAWWCCPDPCLEKVGQTDYNFINNIKFRGRLVFWLYETKVCVYHTDVTCPGEGTVKKWVVYSRKTYAYTTDYISETNKSYSRATTASTCFKKLPGADCSYTAPTEYSGSCVNALDGFSVPEGYFCFERIKFYDTRPSGSITFTDSDLLGDCTVADCDVGGSCYITQVCINFDPCDSCLCTATLQEAWIYTTLSIPNRCSGRFGIPTLNCGTDGPSVEDNCMFGSQICVQPTQPPCCEKEFRQFNSIALLPCLPKTNCDFPSNTVYETCVFDSSIIYGELLEPDMGDCYIANPPYSYQCWNSGPPGPFDYTLWLSMWITGKTCEEEPSCCRPGYECPQCLLPGGPEPIYGSTYVHISNYTLDITCTKYPTSICINSDPWTIELTWPT